MGDEEDSPPSTPNEAVAVMGLFSLSNKEDAKKESTTVDKQSEASGDNAQDPTSSSSTTTAVQDPPAADSNEPDADKDKSAPTAAKIDATSTSTATAPPTATATAPPTTASASTSKGTGTGTGTGIVPGPAILMPRTNDILSGRGNGANQHTGNIYFRNLIASYKRKYVLSEPVIKKQITHQVLAVIESRKPAGRFLKQDAESGDWQELDRDTALRKTAQALREKAPQLKKKVLEEAERKDMLVESLKRKSIDGANKGKKLRTLPTMNDAKAPINYTQNRNGLTADFFAQPQLHHPHMQHATPLQFPTFFQNVPTMDAQQQQQQLNLVSVPNSGLILSQNDLLQTTGILRTLENQQSNHEVTLQQQPGHDASLLTVTPQDQAQSSGFMPFTFNYKGMTITPHAEVLSEKSSKVDKSAPGISSEKSTEMLENIIVVASTSCDLTALYLIVSMSAHAFNGPLFSNQQVKPRNHDVIINADDITNHAGNLTLAESIQSYRSDYLQSGYSNKMKDDIVQLIHATVTNENNDASAKKGRFLINNASRDGKSHWSVLPGSDACSMIKSLFEQACAFILNPDAHDVLFGCDDRSRLSPGNIFFKSIIRRCKPLFLQSPAEKKMQYATEIVGFVTSRPGRFLGYIENMGMWIPLPFESAIEHTQEHLDASTGEVIQMQNPNVLNALRIAPNELIQSLHQTIPSSNFATTIQQSPLLHGGNMANQFTSIAPANIVGSSPLAIQGSFRIDPNRNGTIYK